ncbi:putative ISXo8 transposase [Streptomyces xanthochromogenes]
MRRHQLHPADTNGESVLATGLGAELSARLFESLQRSGQRLNAEQYVRGLLTLPGRKTLRNIAAQFDGVAAQQRVHHFISTSPWDWMPLRRDLADYARQTLMPDAWVMRPTVIPKSGLHSIGVGQHYLPDVGRLVNGQQAVGTWLASGQAALPVDWRLRLPERWLESPLRQRANIPDGAMPGTLEECVGEAVTEVAAAGNPPHCPVVVDADGVDGVALVRRLSTLGIQSLVRVHPDTQLRLDRTALPKYGDGERAAGELTTSLTRLRQRVNPGDSRTTASVIPVVAASSSRGASLLLIRRWSPAGLPDERLWLTPVGTSSLASVLALTRLPDIVARDFAAVSERVGMRDFAGRSYPGWHRHITLACIAHLVAVLGPGDTPRSTRG